MSATLWITDHPEKTLDLGGTIQMYQAFGEMQDLAGAGHMETWPNLWGVSTQVELQEESNTEWLADVRDEAKQFLAKYRSKLSDNAVWILAQLEEAKS